jgi:DNA polymerase V
MKFGKNPEFNYAKEPSRDILCIDCKSFYSSVECVERGLNPIKAKLVVMSYPSDSLTERGSGLILASSPKAKEAYGITNVSRARDLPFPYPDDLVIAPPRMALYMRKNMEINNIYKKYADEVNHHVYSVDESFIDVTDGLKMYGVSNAYELARLIQLDVHEQMGLYTAIGIGDNPLLAKLALDNESKHNSDMKAEWRYASVSKTVWKIASLEEMWGIGRRTAMKLRKMGIKTVDDLAHSNYYQLKEKMGILGTQLYAHSWGIDRSFLGQTYQPKSKSIGNSQVLPRDYTQKKQLEVVIKELGTRLRREGVKAQLVSLWVGFSLGYTDWTGKGGFHQQVRIPATNTTKELVTCLLTIFEKYYKNQDVRNISVNCGDLIYTTSLQLSLFEEPEQQERQIKTDLVVDTIRHKFGFGSIVHAHSLLEGGRAIARSNLVGGHAGGLAGIEGVNTHDSQSKTNEKGIS